MKRHTTILFIIFLFMMASIGYTMREDKELMDLLPENTESLAVESEKIYETPESLYEYINGGAELYLNYGFRKMARRVYKTGDGNEINVELFDMILPKNAFGVFSYSKDTANTNIGQGAQYIGGSLIFWQDRYFVSISARKETSKIKEEILDIGQGISEAIGTTGELPPVFSIIPERSLVKSSKFYFHHHAWQNKYRYITNDNVFNIDDDVNALLNQYGSPQKRHYLLIVEYPDSKKARKALKKGKKKFSETLKGKRVGENDEGLWMGCEVKDQLLMFVVDAPGKEEATYLLDQTAENYTEIE